MKAYTKIKGIEDTSYKDPVLVYLRLFDEFFCYIDCDLRAYNLYEVKPHSKLDIRLNKCGKIWGDL